MPVTVDEILTQVKQAVQAGAAMPVSDTALEALETRYRGPFSQRLSGGGNWEREGRAVLNASRQLGVIAAAIASLQGAREIVTHMFEAAANVTEAHCQIGREEGRWCP